MEFVPRRLASALVLSFQSYFFILFSSCTSNSNANSNTLYIHISSAIRPPTLNLQRNESGKGAVGVPMLVRGDWPWISIFRTFWKLGRGSAFILFFFPSGFTLFGRSICSSVPASQTISPKIPASQLSTDPRHQARHDIQVPLGFQLPQSSWISDDRPRRVS
jgi:hypothetical protein